MQSGCGRKPPTSVGGARRSRASSGRQLEPRFSAGARAKRAHYADVLQVRCARLPALKRFSLTYRGFDTHGFAVRTPD